MDIYDSPRYLIKTPNNNYTTFSSFYLVGLKTFTVIKTTRVTNSKDEETTLQKANNSKRYTLLSALTQYNYCLYSNCMLLNNFALVILKYNI